MESGYICLRCLYFRKEYNARVSVSESKQSDVVGRNSSVWGPFLMYSPNINASSMSSLYVRWRFSTRSLERVISFQDDIWRVGGSLSNRDRILAWKLYLNYGREWKDRIVIDYTRGVWIITTESMQFLVKGQCTEACRVACHDSPWPTRGQEHWGTNMSNVGLSCIKVAHDQVLSLNGIFVRGN
jgi:hypothetical protein